MNLICYAYIISLAISMLQRGKLIVAMIGLIPTNLFLASNYSYDWWVTSFVVLGYAIFLEHGKRKMGRGRYYTICIIVIVIAMIADQDQSCRLERGVFLKGVGIISIFVTFSLVATADRFICVLYRSGSQYGCWLFA